LFSPILPIRPSSPSFPYTTLFRSSGYGDLRYHYCSHLHFLLYGVRVKARNRANGCRVLFLGQLERPHRLPPGIGGVPQRELFFRSEEHTSELQSRENLVCRLLLEK